MGDKEIPTSVVADDDGTERLTAIGADDDGMEIPTAIGADDDGKEMPTSVVADDDGTEILTEDVADDDGTEKPIWEKAYEVLRKELEAEKNRPPPDETPQIGIVINDYDDEDSYFIDVRSTVKESAVANSEDSVESVGVVDKSVHDKFDFVAFRLLTDAKVKNYTQLVKDGRLLFPHSNDMTKWEGEGKCLTILNLSGVSKAARKNPELISHKSLKCIRDQIAIAEHLGTPILFNLNLLPIITISELLWEGFLQDVEFERSLAPGGSYKRAVAAVNICDTTVRERQGLYQVEGPDPWIRWHELRVLCKHSYTLRVMIRLPFSQLKDVYERTGRIMDNLALQRWLSEPIYGIMITPDGLMECLQSNNAFVKLFIELISCFMIKYTQILIVPGNCPASVEKMLEIVREQITKVKADRTSTSAENYSLKISSFKVYCRPLNFPMFLSRFKDDFENEDFTLHELYKNAVTQVILKKFDKEGEPFAVLIPSPRHWNFVYAILKGIVTSMCVGNVCVYILQESISLLENLKARATKEMRKSNLFQRFTLHWVNASVSTWEEKVEVDLIVSKAFGSFGCDMMLPEVIQSSMKFLKRDGIVVPHSLKCFVAPVMDPKMYRFLQLKLKATRFFNTLVETPMKSTLDRAFQLDSEKVAFEYKFGPNILPANRNTTAANLTFTCCFDGVLYGFAGYFEALLSPSCGTKVSTRPNVESKDKVCSWLPTYFPLKNFVNVRQNQQIQCTVMRCTNPSKMWYQWCLTNPPSPMHNIRGICHSIDKLQAQNNSSH